MVQVLGYEEDAGLRLDVTCGDFGADCGIGSGLTFTGVTNEEQILVEGLLPDTNYNVQVTAYVGEGHRDQANRPTYTQSQSSTQFSTTGMW